MILGAIPYQRNEAVPPHRRGRDATTPLRVGELELPPDRASRGRTTVTYDLNRLQSLGADRDLLVTLNRTEAIDPAAVIRVIDYAHPVFTPDGVEAQRALGRDLGRRRTHYCGAYWRWGFHEDGVWSALRVSSALWRPRSLRAAE